MNAAVIVRRAGFEHRLFALSSLALLVLVVTGFARTYFLKLAFGTPELTPLLHLHGALMSAWFVLFLAQVGLVASRRVRWHRRLGIAGAVLALAIVVVGPVVLLNATAREVRAPDGDPFFFVVFAVDSVILIDFAILVATAIALRKRSDFHRRLMLLATASILLPALGRLDLDAATIWLVFYACVLVPVAIDTWRHRLLHPAFALGAPLLLASQHLAYFGAKTAPWTQFVKDLFA
jgi:hypothetical protein